MKIPVAVVIQVQGAGPVDHRLKLSVIVRLGRLRDGFLVSVDGRFFGATGLDELLDSASVEFWVIQVQAG
jgi:hypothetical protein